MSSRVIVDTPVILAIVHREITGSKLDSLLEALEFATISSVNLAEAYGKLIAHGMRAEFAWQDVLAPVHEVIPFTAIQARIAGELLRQTRPYGLSLGDRACLALAITTSSPIYTADRIWKNLKLNVPVHLIR